MASFPNPNRLAGLTGGFIARTPLARSAKLLLSEAVLVLVILIDCGTAPGRTRAAKRPRDAMAQLVVPHNFDYEYEQELRFELFVGGHGAARYAPAVSSSSFRYGKVLLHPQLDAAYDWARTAGFGRSIRN